jgi:hypothetical protein
VPLVVTFDETLTAEAVKAVAGGEITHEYERCIQGVALSGVPTANLGSLMNLRGVTGVYVDQTRAANRHRSAVDRRSRRLGRPRRAGNGR